MRIKFIIFFIGLCLVSQAQIFHNPIPVPFSNTSITEKDKQGFFISQKVKGKLSGTGIYKYKNGTLYIGDFKDKKPNGYGMLICAESDTIINCPNAVIYVGKFKEGIKKGKGVCYNKLGELIYSGSFDDNSPSSDYIIPSQSRYFSDARTEDFYYIGEFEDTNPNGFGAIFFNNGDILISRFEEGQRTGINVYIEHDGNWVSENVEKGNSTFISSSREYASYVEGSKSEWNAGWKKAMGSLSDWAVALNELAIAMGGTSMNSSYNYMVESPEDTSKSSSTTKRGTSLNNERNNISEQRSYNQDKSTYSKYDGMLSQAFAGNRNASQSEIKSWQNKMKQLRKKWESRGKDFPHSSNEDK